MPIRDLVTTLETTLDRLERASADESQVTLAANRLKGLATRVSELERMVASAAEVVRAGGRREVLAPLRRINPPPDPTDPFRWLQEEGVVNLRDLVQEVAQAMGSGINAAWQSRLAELPYPPADRGTVVVLESIAVGSPSIRQAVRALQEASEDHAELRRTQLPQDGDGAQLREIEQRLEAAWTIINGAGVDPERLELLRASATLRGYPLADLTGEQLTWLQQSGAASTLAIRKPHL